MTKSGRLPQPDHGSPYGTAEQKELFLTKLICARLQEMKRKHPAASASIDDLLTELIVVTIDG